jgi:hypothetical protein
LPLKCDLQRYIVVHSFTENNGHSTESDSSDSIELPIETLEAERERRHLEEGSRKKKSLLAVIKEKFRLGVASVLEALSFLLDPACYPVDEVKEQMKKMSSHAFLRSISANIDTYDIDQGEGGIKSKSSSARAAGLAVNSAGMDRGGALQVESS